MDGSWADFDAKKDPKSNPKWSQNGIEKQSKNKIDLGSKKRRVHWDSAPTGNQAGAVDAGKGEA